MTLPAILTLSILFNVTLSLLYHRHWRRELEERNQRIDELETLLHNRDVYIAELQRRCRRRQQKPLLPGPNFSDYFVEIGHGRSRLHRLWWN